MVSHLPLVLSSGSSGPIHAYMTLKMMMNVLLTFFLERERLLCKAQYHNVELEKLKFFKVWC